MTTRIEVKRVYQPADPADGFRILVDRLWPRGLAKEAARIDLWLKDISPSNELRHRFHHDPSLWEEFKASYFAELAQHAAAVEQMRGVLAKHRVVTLLFGAKEERFNNAVALREFLVKKKS